MINNAHLIGFCIAYFNGCFSDFHSKFLQSHKFYFLILPKQTKKSSPRIFSEKAFLLFFSCFSIFLVLQGIYH
ncbi:hypothetical protein Y289_02115 [Listeria monocytogenes]|nr:hypothetical protein B0X20_06675 [Listeria monocytogenes]EAE1678956.1 hypothetical protein [Listeria monocytogenes LIS0071]EAL08135.1 hypothetical protein LMOh7858_1364 [Listeria monocytogenes str. 4b H7858] [Listeria monocytogenes serotype 4b str. H7858]MCX62608.1 hypothetical protein [Listeria monocytogenes serotype 4b]AVD53564.1 hypothetical protein RK58_005975 [Listeria monocytogenes]